MLASNAPQQETGDGLCLGFLATQGSGKDCYDGRRQILRALPSCKRAGKGSTRETKNARYSHITRPLGVVARSFARPLCGTALQ